MDRETVMDPAASPARPGVRRVNNVPLLILGGAVAIFLGIMAYVAVGRSSRQATAEAQPTLRSALPLAKAITGDYEAGTVPAADTASGARDDNARAAHVDSGTKTLPVIAVGKDDFLPPPRPPRLRGTEDEHPGGLAPVAAMPADAVYHERAGDDARDITRMKLDLLKEAVRAKTSAYRDQGRTSGTIASDSEAEGDSAPERPGAASYIEKLRALQEAGLIPGNDEKRKHGDGTDAYAEFAGKEREDRWSLGSRLEAPSSPYELRAGAVVPATLQTGINSDLPGQITAIVAQDVRDTAKGKYVLIPQGSRLVGSYGSDVKFGQERVLVAWQRLVCPDGKALDIGAMPGSDGAGYAGFRDQVDSHFWRLFSSAIFLSAITAGISMSQDSVRDEQGRTTVGGAMAQGLGQQLGQTSEELIRKQMNVAPTIEIRPGYRFNVQVTKDLVFNGPYSPFDYERSITARPEANRLRGRLRQER